MAKKEPLKIGLFAAMGHPDVADASSPSRSHVTFRRGRRSGLGLAPPRSALAARRSSLERETTCQHRAGSSLEWDFDGNIELGVVGLHVPPVLVSELLKDLAELRLVGEKTSARGERLPTGLQADGRGLAQVFVPVGI